MGQKLVSSVLIAVDTVFFLLVFKEILTEDLDVFVVTAMALGYVVGYYLGSIIEDKLALGHVMITLKTSKQDSPVLAELLKKHGFVFIQSKKYYNHNGKHMRLHKGIIFRRELPHLKHLVKDYNLVGIVKNVKEVFGKKILNAEEYLELQREEIN